MKRFWIHLTIFLGSAVGIAVLNNVVLLRLHPLAYYYTPAGMLLSMAVQAVELLISWPLRKRYWNRIILPAWNEGLK